jgi:hypothetical protein
MAEWSEARSVLGCQNTGIVGSKRTRGVDVCRRFWVVLSCVGGGLASGQFSVQGVLQTVQIDS